PPCSSLTATNCSPNARTASEGSSRGLLEVSSHPASTAEYRNNMQLIRTRRIASSNAVPSPRSGSAHDDNTVGKDVYCGPLRRLAAAPGSHPMRISPKYRCCDGVGQEITDTGEDSG